MSSVNEAVAAAWDKVVDDWTNQSRHDALLALATQAQAFQWLATKYRERAGDPIADAQLAKLTTAAMATMLTSSSASKGGTDYAAPYRRALMWMLVMVVMLVLGLIAMKLMASGHPPAPR